MSFRGVRSWRVLYIAIPEVADEGALHPLRAAHGTIPAILLGNDVLHSPTLGAGDLQPNRASNVIRIVVWSLAGVVVLLALVFAVTAATLPGCAQCHHSADFVAQSAKSRHADIACTRCHVEPGVAPRITYAYHMIFGMALHLEPVGSGPVAGISDQTCLSCHAAVMTGVVKGNGLSIDHSKCSKGRMCTDCHSDTAHGQAVKWIRTSSMNQCLECHATQRVRADCTTCHGERTAQQLMNKGEWAVTHGPKWKQTHGMGDLKACAACHPDNFCVRCHGLPLPHDSNFIRNHPAYALTLRQDCIVCHRQTFCDSCHGLEMPHPATFTPTHSALVKKRGSVVCMRCHIQDDCTNCHLKHVHPGGAVAPPGGGAK